MVEEEGEMKDLDPLEAVPLGLEAVPLGVGAVPLGVGAVPLGVEAACFRSTVLGREALQRLDEVEEEEVAGGWKVV